MAAVAMTAFWPIRFGQSHARPVHNLFRLLVETEVPTEARTNIANGLIAVTDLRGDLFIGAKRQHPQDPFPVGS